MTWIKTAKKAIGALLVGLLGWGTAVVQSAPGPVTATEWIMLATVGVTVLTTYVLTNDPV